MTDYLDEDVAYLLGMIVARGTFHEHRGHYTISIEIPYTNIQIDDPPYHEEGGLHHLLASLDKIINRFSELTTNTPRKMQGDNSVSIIFEIPRRTIFVRNLSILLDNKKDYTEFLIPKQIFEAPISYKKEFMRGFADVNAKVRKANAFYNGENRIYIDILNNNWKLPIQLCNLLQNHLNIPLQTLTWGHPNIRDSKKKKWLKREHQIKVYNNDFEDIGFYIEHKNKKSKKFAKENEKLEVSGKKCDPFVKMKRKPRIKPSHPEEKNRDLPDELRGKHYNSFWEICRDLGCKEFEKQVSIMDLFKEDSQNKKN
ncbi:MAG: hypothetical protein ACFFG0_14625 [Candidatus Thorarchaeota archaeon]